MNALRWVAFAVLITAAGQAWSQALYKSVRPDGSVEYGDKPSRDAVRVERYELAPGTPQDAERAAAQRADDQRRLREFEERERRRAQAYDRAEAEIRDALEALATAQRGLEAGTEPQPGEVTGTVRGRTRLNDAYQARMQALSDAVAQAQRRLDRAYAARNALRD